MQAFLPTFHLPTDQKETAQTDHTEEQATGNLPAVGKQGAREVLELGSRAEPQKEVAASVLEKDELWEWVDQEE